MIFPWASERISLASFPMGRKVKAGTGQKCKRMSKHSCFLNTHTTCLPLHCSRKPAPWRKSWQQESVTFIWEIIHIYVIGICRECSFQDNCQAGEKIASPGYSYHHQTESYSDGRIIFLLAISYASPLLIGPECKIVPEFWNCPQSCSTDKKQKMVPGMYCVIVTPDLPALSSAGQISWSVLWELGKWELFQLLSAKKASYYWGMNSTWSLKCLVPLAQGCSLTSLNISATCSEGNCAWCDTRTGCPRLGRCLGMLKYGLKLINAQYC